MAINEKNKTCPLQIRWIETESILTIFFDAEFGAELFVEFIVDVEVVIEVVVVVVEASLVGDNIIICERMGTTQSDSNNNKSSRGAGGGGGIDNSSSPNSSGYHNSIRSTPIAT